MKTHSFYSHILLILSFFSCLNAHSAIYYSNSAASNPNSTANWFANTNNTGGNPANFTTAGDVFVIQTGHTYTTTAAWNVTGTVQVAGNLTIGTANSIGSLTIVTGGLVTGNAVTTISAAGTFTIQDGGKYILNHGSPNTLTTFNGTEGFSSNSTFEYQNLISPGTFVSGITYGNFIYNAALTNTFPAAITINGNFEMMQGTLDFSSTRTIGGNFIQSGGTVLLKSSTINGNYNQTSGTATLESSTIKGNMLIDGVSAVTRITQSTSSNVDAIVEGNLEVKAGTFQMNDGLQNVPSFATDLFIYENFIVNGGIFNWPTSATTAVAGRVFVNKDVRFLSGTVGGFLSTSTLTAGLYFEGPNEQTFTNAFTLSTGDLKNAFYFKSPPPASFFINEQYIGTTGQQISVNGGFGTPRVGYDRWPPATSTNIIRTFTINNPNGVLLRDSRNIKDTLYRTIGSITADPTDPTVEVISYSTGATLEYNGTSAITTESMEFPSASGPTNLNINNAGSVTLHASRSINGNLIFSVDNGLLNTTSCNESTTGSAIITLNDGASVTGAGNNRFVNGVITKIGNDAFTFPIGEKQSTTYKYAPVQISTPSNVADSYSACYVGSNPNPTYNTNSKDATLITPNYQVSTCEYWHFNKAVASTDVKLTLSWAYGRSCAFNKSDSLVVTNWLTSTTPDQWTNLYNDGNNTPGPGPTQTFGWVTSKDPVSNYGTFTLASPTMATTTLSNSNVRLSGIASKNKHLLTCNLQDCNGASLEIEFSNDGQIFNRIAIIDVSETDRQRGYVNYTRNVMANSTSFYRIKVKKSGSEYYYSNIVRLIAEGAISKFSLFPNPFATSLQLSGNLEDVSSIRVQNAMGQTMIHQQVSPGNRLELQTTSWPNGIYYISVLYRDGRTESIKVVK